ncbi:hypothetical protein QTP88_008946 [Uroleucon formosanum]
MYGTNTMEGRDRVWEPMAVSRTRRDLGTEFRRFLLFRGGYGGFDDDASVSIHVTGERGHFSAKTKRNRAIYCYECNRMATQNNKSENIK